MPTTMGDSYEPGWMGHPPHMSRDDYQLWLRWRAQAQKDAIRFYFDVGLGGQEITGQDVSPEMAFMWLRNTQKRADVVIETQTEWRLVELRTGSTGSEIGRLLVYKELWEKDPPDLRPLKLILVSGRFDADVRNLCDGLGITYIFIPL